MASGGPEQYYRGRPRREDRNYQDFNPEQHRNYKRPNDEDTENFQWSSQDMERMRLEEDDDDPGARDKQKMMVAAIDFGTTFSGYAFALRSDFQKDPMRVTGNQWTTGGNAGVSLKTSTCALFKPDMTFDSFGFEAEDTYSNLTIDNAHSDWYYFRRFKMMLYNNQYITRDSTIEDDKGNTMKAMDVYVAVISYLRKHMLDSVNVRNVGIDEEEIYWVLTVPAIWSDGAKQFMREAAEKAGISPRKLEMALEPEAASIFCKHIPVGKREHSDDCDAVGMESLRAGVKYLVVDAGGGTVDITVQEVQLDGSLKQVYMANGGDWGGTKIDEAFEDFLVSLVTREIFEQFKMQHRDAYVDLMREFEIKKRTITPKLDHKVTFKIPIALNELYQEAKGQTLKDSFSGNRSGRNLAWIGDKLRVEADDAKGLFEHTCNAIVEHIETIFLQPDAAGTTVILLCGGFSESPMLREAVKGRFSERMKVIIPQEAGLCVLKGAVLYGFDTKVISTRVCKETYGIRILDTFREGQDPEDCKKIVGRRTYCTDRFSKHVQIGQKVTLGETTEPQSYYPLYEDQTQIALTVYTSKKDDPQYCKKENCTYIGNLNVDIPVNVPGKDRGVDVCLMFGGTELAVISKVQKTGEKMSASFDLLG